MTQDRIPTLDGWRGIAILMVIIAHFQAGYFPGHSTFHHWAWLILGGHGVAIFFVLSGYLITTRLFDDPDLKHFYVRRVFRLWPVAWCYLILLALIGLLSKSEALACVLFYRNFVMTTERALTGHFWTLSVEEQFYLLWPPVLMFGRKPVGILIAALCLFTWLHQWPYFALVLGCLLAFAVRQAPFRQWIIRQRWCFPLSLLGFVFCIARFQNDIPIVELLVIAVMLASTSINGCRWLEWKPLAEIGIYSYSLYVWQELLLITHTGIIGVTLLPLVAVGSFYVIERPCVEFGKQLLKRSLRDRSIGQTEQSLEPLGSL